MSLHTLNSRLLSLIIVLFFLSCKTETTSSEWLVDYVDPYIGSGGHGHVFVGASTPFGAVQVGPDNFNKGWDWCSGYHYSDSITKGFSHLHLSGTGIGDLSDILIMPATGKLKMNSGTQDDINVGYASKYSHDNEKVQPGYYSVILDRYDVNIKMTTSDRVAIHKIEYPKHNQSRLILDMSEGNGSDKPTKTYLEVVNDSIVFGYRFSTGWAKDQREYFALVISKPADEILLSDGEKIYDSRSIESSSSKAFLEFRTFENEVLSVKVGLSPVSMSSALENIKKEIPNWDFDKVLADNQKSWNEELSRIKIKEESIDKKEIFYTSMYHAFFAPTLFNDCDSTYRGTDNKIYKNADYTNYTLFSLWDTYRASHPLFTLIQPDRVPDMIKSMLSIYEQQRKLPIWHLRGNETNTMIGYSAVPIIIDAYFKGFEFDKELAYQAVINSSKSGVEPGIEELEKYGYIPGDSMVESVARSLEYAISDWAISQFASDLGHEKEALHYAERAQVYKQYYDKHDRFMKAKMKDGSWRTPFNPIYAAHRTNDYCEGNAWQYIWLVPQDPEGLIELFGSDDLFVEKLDSLFSISAELGDEASPDISGLIGQYAHGNEPGHHSIYLYAYAGEQHKTAEKARYILENLYKPTPDGISGNEDCGQMSAWYILSSVGFYPVNPTAGIYVFGSPLFDEVSIELAEDKEFVVKANNNSENNIYIQSVQLNGKDYSKSYISHSDIVKGGELVFEMGDTPNLSYGSNLEDRPQSKIYR